ncbi:MAG: hypothetical protein PHU80_10405, partial [Kiritimatiellae bacterium]|nr:hypothetical protein [Kiritimatiellia bacterium]
QNPADHIRIHGVITQGGLAANIIPDKAVLSLLVRARTLRAMEDAAAMTERCARGAAEKPLLTRDAYCRRFD